MVENSGKPSTDFVAGDGPEPPMEVAEGRARETASVAMARFFFDARNPSPFPAVLDRGTVAAPVSGVLALEAGPVVVAAGRPPMSARGRFFFGSTAPARIGVADSSSRSARTENELFVMSASGRRPPLVPPDRVPLALALVPASGLASPPPRPAVERGAAAGGLPLRLSTAVEIHSHTVISDGRGAIGRARVLVFRFSVRMGMEKRRQAGWMGTTVAAPGKRG